MERYELDDSGQWWCYQKRGRVRASAQTCEQCGKRFPNRHPQRFCSRACRAAATKGVARVDRPPVPCPECGTVFQPSQARTARYGARYCSRECGYKAGNRTRGRKGPANPKWKGGIKSHALGYVREWDPARGYVLQHRLVMEQMLGRPLAKGENVHHKNGIRDDNRPENLELWAKHQPPGQRAVEQRHCETCTCN
jgi:hypothetical protein